MKIIKEYQTERKDRKLIQRACTQLNRPSDQLIDNHGEFQALCDDHEELQEANRLLYNAKVETTPELKQKHVPINDIKYSKQKVKEWLKTVLQSVLYLGLNVQTQFKIRRICMESSEHNWANISEAICSQKLLFGKQASQTLFFQNILTNPIISQI